MCGKIHKREQAYRVSSCRCKEWLLLLLSLDHAFDGSPGLEGLSSSVAWLQMCAAKLLVRSLIHVFMSFFARKECVFCEYMREGEYVNDAVFVCVCVCV